MLYVEPEQEVAALSVSCGWVQGVQEAGELTATVCDPHEAVAVKTTFVPMGILMNEFPLGDPAEETTVVPLAA